MQIAPRFNYPVVRYRRLIWEMTKRDLKNRYAGSYLGLFWSIIVPIMSAVVYIGVFSMLSRGTLSKPYSEFSFSLYYFSGVTPWLLFSETVVRSLGCIRSNSSLVTKVSFPTEILPFSVFLSVFITHLVFILVTLFLGFRLGIPLFDRIELLPIFFISLFLLTIGVSLMLCAFAVYVPDLIEIVPVLLTLLFFCSPILYTSDFVLSQSSPVVSSLLVYYNPFHYLVQGYRISLLSVDIYPNWISTLVLLVVSLIVAVIGAFTFNRLRRGFADVL